MTLKLFKIGYHQNHSKKAIIKYIEAYKQMEAINIGVPYELNGEEQKIDTITVECLCEMEQIMHCASAGSFETETTNPNTVSVNEKLDLCVK